VGAGHALTVRAPAKVNLFLSVGPVRGDGYHDLVTVFCAIDVFDSVTVAEASSLSVVTEPSVGGEPAENLAFQAAARMAAAVGGEPRISVHIDKRIPVAAGLGGGSADAAAVLVALAHLWELPTDDRRVSGVAAGLGADVPFFLEGGTALYGGRGDVRERGLPTPDVEFVLVNPGVPVSTQAVYRAFDESPRADPVSAEPMIEAVTEGVPGRIADVLANDLAEPAAGVAPAVAGTIEWLEGRKDVLGSTVSGSGGTVFGVCADHESAVRAAADARSEGWWAAACRPVEHGAIVVRGVEPTGGEEGR
jgi:4-diphosphocytidyl-2-C-methyl-D-erythritol kinase